MSVNNLFDLKMVWEYDCYQSGKDSFIRGLLYLQSTEVSLSKMSKNQSHLVMVLDISGSMNTQNKYPLLKQALEIMLANLEDGFYISIILFSSHAQLICKALPGNEAKNKIADIIEAIDNSPVRFQATNLSYGLDMAFDIVREYRKHREEVIPRIYILTDGDLTDTQQCYARTKELESLNVEVNSYGFGNDFAFETMKQLMGATYGGMIKHISNNNDIIETFQRIIQVTALIVASEVNFKVTFEDGVIPGDFFCYRPAIRFWQASDFMPPKAPQFDVGNIEAQRKYIWAI
jgi:Ca-activated chloride channel homolog